MSSSEGEDGSEDDEAHRVDKYRWEENWYPMAAPGGEVTLVSLTPCGLISVGLPVNVSYLLFSPPASDPFRQEAQDRDRAAGDAWRRAQGSGGLLFPSSSTIAIQAAGTCYPGRAILGEALLLAKRRGVVTPFALTLTPPMPRFPLILLYFEHCICIPAVPGPSPLQYTSCGDLPVVGYTSALLHLLRHDGLFDNVLLLVCLCRWSWEKRRRPQCPLTRPC